MVDDFKDWLGSYSRETGKAGERYKKQKKQANLLYVWGISLLLCFASPYFLLIFIPYSIFMINNRQDWMG